MVHLKACKFIQDRPCGRSVYIIVQNDFADFFHLLLIQIFQHRVQLIRIAVFAVHHQNHALLACMDKLIDPEFGNVAGIRYTAQILKIILVLFIQQCHKFFIVVKNKSIFAAELPVDVGLVGILHEIGVVFLMDRPYIADGLAVGH